MGMTEAFVGFIVVALVEAPRKWSRRSRGARKNRLDLSVGIALGSATQIALFVAPVLVLASYVLGPSPMTLAVLARCSGHDAVRHPDGGAGYQRRPSRLVCRACWCWGST